VTLPPGNLPALALAKPMVLVTGFLAARPAGVLRAKALVTVIGEPGVRRLFERVGAELMGAPLQVPISDRVPSSAICIGPDLEPAALLESARREFGRACQLPDPDRP